MAIAGNPGNGSGKQSAVLEDQAGFWKAEQGPGIQDVVREERTQFWNRRRHRGIGAGALESAWSGGSGALTGNGNAGWERMAGHGKRALEREGMVGAWRRTRCWRWGGRYGDCATRQG